MNGLLFALSKACGRVHAIPSFMAKAIMAGLAKGRTQKYLRKVPTGKLTKTGKIKYRYFYRTVGGKGLGHHDEMVAGAAFKMRDGDAHGHFHVTHDHGDGHVTIKHDESGKEHKIHKDVLAAMLHNEHAEVRKQDDASAAAKRDRAKVRALADMDEAKRSGTAKHVEAARKRAVAAGYVEEKGLEDAAKQKAADNAQREATKKAQEESGAESKRKVDLDSRPPSLADDHPVMVKLKEVMSKAKPLPTKPIDAQTVPTAKEANLKRLQGFASKDKTRPQLTGVHADGTYAVATDEHRLVIAPTSHKAERMAFPDTRNVLPKKDAIASSHSFDSATLYALADAAIAHDKAREAGDRGAVARVSFHRTSDGAVHAAIGAGSDRDGKVAPGVKVPGKTHQAPDDDHLEADGGGIHLNARYLKEALAGHKGPVTVNFNKNTNAPVDIHRTDGERHLIMPIKGNGYGAQSKSGEQEDAKRREAEKQEREAEEAAKKMREAKLREERRRHDSARDAARAEHVRLHGEHLAASRAAWQHASSPQFGAEQQEKWAAVAAAHERAAGGHHRATQTPNYFEVGPAAHALSEEANKLQAEAPEPERKTSSAPPSHEEMVQRFKSAGYDGEHPDRLRGKLSDLHESLAEHIAEHLVATDGASYQIALEEAHEQLEKVLKDATPPEAKARKALDLEDVENDEPHIKGHANLVHEGAELHDHETGEVHKVLRMDKDGAAHFKGSGPGGKAKLTRAELSAWFGDGKTKTIRPDDHESYLNDDMDQVLSHAVSNPEGFIPYSDKDLKPGREVHTHDGEVFAVSESGKLEDNEGKEHDPDEFDFQHGKVHIKPSDAEIEAKKKQISLFRAAVASSARILAKARRGRRA